MVQYWWIAFTGNTKSLQKHTAWVFTIGLHNLTVHDSMKSNGNSRAKCIMDQVGVHEIRSLGIEVVRRGNTRGCIELMQRRVVQGMHGVVAFNILEPLPGE